MRRPRRGADGNAVGRTLGAACSIAAGRHTALHILGVHGEEGVVAGAAETAASAR